MRLGVLRETGTNVAIKSCTRDEDTQDFLQEAENLKKKLSKPGHPNVVRLVGVCNLASDLPWGVFRFFFLVLFLKKIDACGVAVERTCYPFFQRKDQNLFIVLEHCPNGNLQAYLCGNFTSPTFDNGMLFFMGVDVTGERVGLLLNIRCSSYLFILCRRCLFFVAS